MSRREVWPKRPFFQNTSGVVGGGPPIPAGIAMLVLLLLGSEYSKYDRRDRRAIRGRGEVRCQRTLLMMSLLEGLDGLVSQRQNENFEGRRRPGMLSPHT